MDSPTIYFNQFIKTAFDQGEFATDDIIAFLLPVFEEVNSFHENGKVAPFENPSALFITNHQLDMNELLVKAPLNNLSEVNKLNETLRATNFEITEKTKVNTDVDNGTEDESSFQIHMQVNEPLKYPAYLPGYTCFELLLQHHDAQTDIFCLGLLLGSIALGLDLNEPEDLKLFVAGRKNPASYQPDIHPVIASLLVEMTALDRAKRSADLYDIIHRLKHYREYNPDASVDLSNVAGWVNKDLKERSQLILNKLRNRLFDTSRRNRLLYFKSNARFVNLTVASVPMVLNYLSIRPDWLFTWNDELAAKVTGMKDIVLNKYLRLEDHLYLPASLDKIRLENQKDKQEYGFSQLKLVITFLHWHNLKEEVQERIQSPLLLLPVELKKTKRIKEDHFTLSILDNVAEVNPVLANQLKELYGIQLPDFVDLTEMTTYHFYELIKTQIESANQGIQLTYSNKPKIKLIQSIANQTVNGFRKRMKIPGVSVGSYKNIPYSYQPENYQPLGLEIFKQRVEPKFSYLEFLVNDDINISSKRLSPDQSRERELYVLTEGDKNPFVWEFDVCNIVLGNFNYKKMSLVRDYNQAIDHNIRHKVFDSLFSQQPKIIQQEYTGTQIPEEWFHVIQADPSQNNAILKSRSGESYIIQGPPGTGKSQTITNLIADFVAHGKTVLFVCEKRAALDVVFHRLKQNKLDELCCYIHDSQSDKRTFVKNLQLTYEDFIHNRVDLKAIRVKRNELLRQMKEQIGVLEHFHLSQLTIAEEVGISVRELIERLIVIKPQLIPLSAGKMESLPPYKNWAEFGDIINALSNQLEENGAEPIFAEHPFSQLADTLFKEAAPLTLLESIGTKLTTLILEINTVLTDSSISATEIDSFHSLKNLIQDAVVLLPLAKNKQVHLADEKHKDAIEFDKSIKKIRGYEKKLEQAKNGNGNWKIKLSEEDLGKAISIAEKHEQSFFKFLAGSWRKLVKQLNLSYSFDRHQVRPAILDVLKKLKAEYEAADLLSKHKEQIQQQYNLDNLDTAYIGIEVLRRKKDEKELSLLLNHARANEIVVQLSVLNNVIQQMEMQLQLCLFEYEQKSLSRIQDEMETIILNASALPALAVVLKQLAALPDSLKAAIRNLPVSPVQLEALMAHRSLLKHYQENRSFAIQNQKTIEQAVKDIKKCYAQLLPLNAAMIRATIRNKFIEHIELSNTAISQLDTDQRNFKKIYNEGRKILENEFAKSMRYKSIRELCTKESSRVLKDLKPVWLMSPLSVSDSLPLDGSQFDVVIFDEASQITLEEGIPTLFRSPQTIIVGDDKQMPPTDFFTAKYDDPDDLDKDLVPQEEDELIHSEADSLLVQGSRKLESTMLTWHYRSHYETLISFSNHAFYEGGLLTIPDKTIHEQLKNEIHVLKREDAYANVDYVFDRSISFHYLENSVYEKRHNVAEADYIALLVCNMLKRKLNESIGIVAFSKEQQETIENALTELAQTDKEFELLLEEAYVRTEHEQFVGLIIKNLENIQGDERDIIIMSVCYGFDERKRLLMNFGPINKKGGEKRLNVLFSRAKKHMAIVSSIKYHHITNEYNEGANYFRRFLQYAENISRGNMLLARSILDGLVLNSGKHSTTVTSNSQMARELKAVLVEKGFEVAEQVGQSGFKCSLAIKLNRADEEYHLGILIDDAFHYNNPNILEQYFQRPALLQSFGWNYVQVFSKDWLQDPEMVVDSIIKLLTTNKDETEATETSELDFQFTATPVIKTMNESLANVNLPVGFEDAIFERYEFREGGSNKFWEIAQHELKLMIRYGRIGSKGQVQIKSFPDEATATKEKLKAIQEKTGKGYEQA